MVTSLDPLSDEAMLDILTNPRNALVKQYQKLMLLEGIDVEFEVGALKAIVKRAKARRTGARALRGVMEEVMNPIMYDLPDEGDVRKCIITEGVVERNEKPLLEYSEVVSNKKSGTLD